MKLIIEWIRDRWLLLWDCKAAIDTKAAQLEQATEALRVERERRIVAEETVHVLRSVLGAVEIRAKLQSGLDAAELRRLESTVNAMAKLQ